MTPAGIQPQSDLNGFYMLLPNNHVLLLFFYIEHFLVAEVFSPELWESTSPPLYVGHEF